MNAFKVLRSGLASLALLQLMTGCATVSEAVPEPLYPNYNTDPLPPETVGMESSATQLAAKIEVGFNIGNTLEAIGGETAWGNPRITSDFVAFVKQTGFTAVRLPVSWDKHANHATAKIDASWLKRVREVVQYCVDNDLYVLVNVHWDGGWLENNVTPESQVDVAAKQRAYWQQIGTLLRDFDEHVLFASANEPNVKTAAQLEVLMSYHEAFIEAVRSTGGRNAYRTLVVQGPNTDIELTHKLNMKLPGDSVNGRLMVEIHDYSPWNFTGMTKDEGWGNQFFYWGKGNHSPTDLTHNPTWGEEAYIDDTFQMMKEQFVDQGIPVVIGEYGAQLRTDLSGENLRLHLASRVSYFGYLTKQALANGLLPFVWDTGGLLDRRTNVVLDEAVVAAMLR